MKKRERKSNRKASEKGSGRRLDLLRPICWIVVPAVIAVLLVLDARGIYTFTEERLIVLGIGLIVILLPFFSEITVKDVSVKRKDGDGKDT